MKILDGISTRYRRLRIPKFILLLFLVQIVFFIFLLFPSRFIQSNIKTSSKLIKKEHHHPQTEHDRGRYQLSPLTEKVDKTRVSSAKVVENDGGEKLTGESGDKKGDDEIILFIAIFSDRSSYLRRQTVRSTWLQFYQLDPKWKTKVIHKFVIGWPACLVENPSSCHTSTLDQERELTQESEQFNDILRIHQLKENIFDDEEADFMLAARRDSETLCGLFDWLSHSMDKKFQYVLKTEDDVFVRLDTVLNELKEAGPRDGFWTGFVWKDMQSNYFYDMSPTEVSISSFHPHLFLPPILPRHTNSDIFILSSDVVLGLTSYRKLAYYSTDALSLAMWLFPYNISVIHDPRFQIGDVCDPSMLSKPNMSTESMQRMYQNIFSSLPNPTSPPSSNIRIQQKVLGGMVFNPPEETLGPDPPSPLRTPNGELLNMCAGFDTSRCLVCYSCKPEQSHWVFDGVECDKRGAKLLSAGFADHVDDSATKGVLGFLPLATCVRMKLEDKQESSNLVVGGMLRNPLALEWEQKGEVELVTTDSMADFKDDTDASIKLTVSSPTRTSSYVSQKITLFPFMNEALVFSAWSRALNAIPTPEFHRGDYSLYADITYDNGESVYGFAVEFDGGTHDWNFNARVFMPSRPIQSISLYGMFRHHTGSVWFDNISVQPLSKALCFLKFQTKFFSFDRDGTEENNNNAIDQDSTFGPTFSLVWLKPRALFLLRHRLAIESIFKHHPNARVRLYSTTLPPHFLYKFNTAGYDAKLIKLDLENLALGTPSGGSWIKRLPEWQSGSYLSNHMVDFAKFILLYRYGGIYLDFDTILVNKVIPDIEIDDDVSVSNTLISRECDESSLKLLYCIAVQITPHGISRHEDVDGDGTQNYVLSSAFMRFKQAEHPLLREVLIKFDQEYLIEEKNIGDMFLSLAYDQFTGSNKNRHSIEATTFENQVEIYSPSAFFPLPLNSLNKYFESNDLGIEKKIKNSALGVCLWEKNTIGKQPTSKSFVWGLLKDYSLSNTNPKPGNI